MEDKLYKSLEVINFDEANNICNEILKIKGFDYLSNLLVRMSNSEDLGLIPLTFVHVSLHDLNAGKKARILRDILRLPLCHLPNAYSSSFSLALFVKSIDTLDKVNNLIILDVGRVCTNLLSDVDAINIAEEILQIDSENIKAKHYIDNLGPRLR